MSIKKENIKLEDVKPDIDKIKIKVENEERKDPTSFLPDEPMVYELKKKKKKKKKHRQEDPFKDIEEKAPVQVIKAFEDANYDPVPSLDPEVTIKVENIEVELDFNDVSETTAVMSLLKSCIHILVTLTISIFL